MKKDALIRETYALSPSPLVFYLSSLLKGFEQAQVIDVLSRRNYRGSNINNVSDDDILNALLG